MASLSDLLGADWRRHARLLALTTPACPDALLAESARIEEALGPVAGHAGFRIELTVLATDGGPSLTALLGEPLRLDLQMADSCSVKRPFHGYITQATRLDASGGLARYRLIVEPWLAFLGHNRDSCLFQDKTVVDIVDEVFAGWRAHDRLEPAWRWDLADPAIYPRRSMCVQYGESDLAFVRRLLVDEGLCCHFEHEAGGGGSLGRHTLVISDHRDAFRVNPRPLACFTQVGVALVDDGLGSPIARCQPDGAGIHVGNGGLSACHERVPGGPGDGLMAAAVAPREVPDALLPDYDREGTQRSAAPGSRFVLKDHSERRPAAPEAREFLITAVHHLAHNSLAECFPERLAALGPIEPWEGAKAQLVKPTDFYRHRLTAQETTLPWRPPAHDAAGRQLYPRPDAARPLTAFVVGPDARFCTERDSHIRVQLSWPCDNRSAGGGGLRGGTDNVVGGDIRGAWLRVVTPAAGGDRGRRLTPRPGQEVLVAFLHGNPDQPVVIGSVLP